MITFYSFFLKKGVYSSLPTVMMHHCCVGCEESSREDANFVYDESAGILYRT